MRLFAQEVLNLGEQAPATTSLRRMFAYWESGQRGVTVAAYQRAFTNVYRATAAELGFVDADADRSADAETVRRDLNELLQAGGATAVRIEDWEQLVARHGMATRDRSPAQLIGELTTTLEQVEGAIERCHAATVLRRLTALSAKISGLMVLTLVKVDRRAEFHQWAGTARLAAAEADDPATLAWVLAQEAYGHFYCGHHSDALTLAGRAQELTAGRTCPAAPLSAALEARVSARQGRHRDARTAIERAENMVTRLDGSDLQPSAFGYNEAQLRFHESNSYTHLRQTAAAFAAQQRALELCAAGDYTDRAMTRLDRAACLIAERDADEAVTEVTETLTGLTFEHRRGIINLRAREVLQALPAKERNQPSAVELHDLLVADDRSTKGPL